MTARRYAPWLWLLTGLFVVRVAAQPAALLVDFLPSFDSWHGGVLPYPVLVAAQLLITAWLAQTARRFTAGDVVPHRQLGRATLVIGSVYFAAMFLRLLLYPVLREQRWFASPLPAFFHLVLATYLLLYGYFHFHHGPASPSSRRARDPPGPSGAPGEVSR